MPVTELSTLLFQVNGRLVTAPTVGHCAPVVTKIF